MSPHFQFPAYRLVALVLAALYAAPTRADTLRAIAGFDDRGYALRTWQVEDGLPQNSITAVTTTPEGRLWLGSYGGLACFDGVQFRTFDCANTPGLADARIVALYAEPDGTLWIGHDSGRITRLRAGTFTAIARHAPGGAVGIVAINRDNTGRLWLLRRDATLEEIDTGRRLRFPNAPASPSLLSLVAATDGTLTVECDGLTAQLVGDRLQPLDYGIAYQSAFVMRTGSARRGGIWVMRDGRVQRWLGESLLETRGFCPWYGSSSLSHLIELRDGTLAIGTIDQGLYLIRPDGHTDHIEQAGGLAQNWIRSLCEDREGNLWMGTGSSGLAQVSLSRFAFLNPPDQWQGRTELSIFAARDDTLWIGTEGAGLYAHRDGRWRHFGPDTTPDLRYVWSIAQPPDGRIWAGTWSSGLFRQDGDRFEHVDSFDPGGPIWALQYIPDDHALWIGCARGLFRWPDSALDAPPINNGDATNVCTFVRDRSGVLWYGTLGGGLGRLADGIHTRFRKDDGLSSDSINALYADPDGTLWIGTADDGLTRYRDGRFATIAAAQGLPSNTICHIADDGHGFLWLSTHHGIVRLAKTDLHRCADGLSPRVDALVLDHNDGLPTIELSGGLHASGARTAEGRLWFPSSKGVVALDPGNLHLNAEPPRVLLERLLVDGHPLEFAAGLPRVLELPPHHTRLVFEYTAPSLTAPAKVLFRYKLAGVDEDWVEAGAKRTATYSRLPAGRYSFRVTACNNDGTWNTTGATLTFTVRPFLWQTWWFRFLASLLLIALSLLLARHIFHRRIRRRLEDLARRHAVERERSRIAQDIHDDIGSSLTRIMMLSQCSSTEAGPDSPAAETRRRIYTAAHGITTALDEIVWAVNPRHDSLDSLVNYMIGEFAQSLLAEAGLRCRLDLPVAIPHWPLGAEVRHNLFLAFKEALNNSIRHAHATEVQIALALQPDQFVLSIADDGRGFTPAPAATATNSHDGLGNMHARLAKIGGLCEIDSRPGIGTRVAFTFPRHSPARS